MIHIFTITARNYLAIALALGESVSRHHPEARFTICVADGLEGVDIVLTNSNHRLFDVPGMFDQSELEDLAFKYNITEYCTSVKPAIFRKIFADEPDTDLVYYMDPDTYLFSRLEAITAATPHKTLYLTPHLIDCRLADDHPYQEYHHLWEGIFNLGFCAIRRTADSEKIVDWWDARLRQYCYADRTDGLHTDQKWMDYAPAFFSEQLEVVRNHGANAAHWNLAERPIAEIDRKYHAGKDELVFFHFSGFDFKGELLTKHAPAEKQKVYLTPAIIHMSKVYRTEVKKQGFDDFIKIPYAFAAFDDGTPITPTLRRLYRELVKDQPLVRPFSAQGSFFALLNKKKLLDKSDAARGNYSKGTVDNLSAKMDRLGRILGRLLPIIGVKRYSQLVKLAGYLGRFENHAFLLKDRV